MRLSALKENNFPFDPQATREGQAMGWKPPGRRREHSLRSRSTENTVGAAVPRVKGNEGGIQFFDTVKIGWYSVRLSRPMAFAMGVFIL